MSLLLKNAKDEHIFKRSLRTLDDGVLPIGLGPLYRKIFRPPPGLYITLCRLYKSLFCMNTYSKQLILPEKTLWYMKVKNSIEFVLSFRKFLHYNLTKLIKICSTPLDFPALNEKDQILY